MVFSANVWAQNVGLVELEAARNRAPGEGPPPFFASSPRCSQNGVPDAAAVARRCDVFVGIHFTIFFASLNATSRNSTCVRAELLDRRSLISAAEMALRVLKESNSLSTGNSHDTPFKESACP